MATKKTTKKTKSKPKKAAAKKAAPKTKLRAKKPAAKKKPAKKKRPARGRRESVATVSLESRRPKSNAAGQSGDLQGLSGSAGADSESVDELLEEGNAFEAEVVDGVENAPDADEGEVRTHEVEEDDVPDEYLDKDK
jgi:N utilization substance protein A